MRRGLILPDMQVPYEDKKAVAAVMAYTRDEEWDFVVQLGDWPDFNSISSHNEGKPKLVEGQRVAKEVAALQASIMEVKDATGSAPLFWLKGNHEWRWDRYVEKYPAMEGLVDLKSLLPDPEDRLIECYPKGDVLKIGHLVFTHGFYTTTNHAKKHAESFGANVVYGHTHQVQQYASTALGKGKVHAAWSMGCLCRLDMPYLSGAPTNWQHAFGEVFFDEKGMFNLYTTVVTNGRFISPGGKSYTWKM